MRAKSSEGEGERKECKDNRRDERNTKEKIKKETYRTSLKTKESKTYNVPLFCLPPMHTVDGQCAQLMAVTDIHHFPTERRAVPGNALGMSPFCFDEYSVYKPLPRLPRHGRYMAGDLKTNLFVEFASSANVTPFS